MPRSTTFSLKYRDTRPSLQAQLRNPDGTVFDLAGTTSWRLHVRLEGGGVVTRAMTKVGADSAGTVQYVWQEADWAELTVGRHEMEYEVLGPDGFRATFPNNTYDTLAVTQDLGQA